jgi:hypothetical protein
MKDLWISLELLVKIQMATLSHPVLHSFASTHAEILVEIVATFA